MSEAPAAHALQPLAGLPPPGTGLFSRDARFAPLSQAAPATLDEPQIDPLDAAHAQGFAEGLSAGRAEARGKFRTREMTRLPGAEPIHNDQGAAR